MQSATSTALLDFHPHVERQREWLFEGVSDFPSALKEVVITNYGSRVARGHGKPLLGEYAPWLLADMLPLSNRQVVAEVALPWMNLYAYTLFIDDVLDIDKKADAVPLMLASQLLLERGFTRLHSLLPSGCNVRLRIDQYFLEAANAVLIEMQEHRGLLRGYSPEEVDRLGRKIAFLKLCAACLLAADGHGGEDQAALLLPVDELATGMQLLDDIADWEEDLKAHSFTPLLTQTLCDVEARWPDSIRNRGNFTSEEVLAAMVVTGALENHIALGISWLDRVAATPGLSPSSPAAHLLGAVIEEHKAVRDQVISVRLSCEAVLQQGGGFGSLLRDEPVRRRVEMVSTQLQIVAQNS
ncbi:MAG TPA: class 1 isoprenoid biosynthesis enzyme [Armatimonadota bacterium]|nr:class 1 isoprenoid biosynthesis enzyme [Armatimonadota bacterium]